MHRRTFVSALPAMLAVAHGLSTTQAQEATPAANGTQPDGSWAFTDDRGRTVHLPEMPTRIFADAGAGLALWELGIKPVGLVGYEGVFEIPDELADVPFLDLSAGEPDIEAILEIDPDISISQAWDASNPNDFAGFDETSWPGFTDIAPTLSLLAVVVPVEHALQRFEELAAALGADLTAPEVVSDRDAFESAREDLRAAAAEKPDLTVMAMSATPESVWIGNPESASDLRTFLELGVNILVPDTPGAAMSGLWQEVSWEEIINYPVDLYLNDDRGYALTNEEVLEQPLFSLMPAAQAGQIGTWTIEYVPSFGSLTPILNALAASIRDAEVVTG